MAYRIYQFDGLLLPEYLPRGGSNDIGSGDALTSFAQLPGGGYFDNYGANDSPQGIRPITRNCILWGDTQEELISNFKALRGKIGRRGRLTVQFDNGELWWQWARLQRVHTPRPLEAVGNFLPCNLTFTTAAQQWYGIIQSGNPWQVGDESFYLGDGIVSLGMHDYSYDLASGITVTHVTLPSAGNTHVRNMQITLATDSLMNFVILGTTNGQVLQWANSGLTGAFTVTIDTGAKSCLVRMDDEGWSLTRVAAEGANVAVTTSGAHGLSSGDSVEITGTDIYDGVHHDIDVINISMFTYKILDDSQGKSVVTTGTAYPVVDGYPNLTIYDRKNWFLLDPGDNDVTINHNAEAGTPAQDYSVQFRWYDHFR